METSEAEVQDLSQVKEVDEEEDDATSVPSHPLDAATLVNSPVEEPELEAESEEVVPRFWTEASPASEQRYAAEIAAIRQTFKDEVDEWDASMVHEYSEEIFEYMGRLEVLSMPDPTYMDQQSEIHWHQRTTLVDWLVQIHARYHLTPETLWIAINIIDRFLSKRVVSLIKLQLVGVTAMFVAAKYEEIMAPSVDEFVFMTENTFTREEILKGEKIILQTLGFHISAYCSPYSWVRKISKADDYDIQTRTLSKFLMEVCLLDHRFLCAKPSMIAAIAMYTSRRMLEGDWNEAFIFYSDFTEEQLLPGFEYMVETLGAQNFSATHTFKKYASKRFLKASIFARQWAKKHFAAAGIELAADDDMEIA
ncbi:hypothetical protein DL93DRAFT_2060475 [Clavulina sp. PMI_390]|nr:hypothetical protein DL93DRAFT_2060475 [Clavulina sp. PMI_390]